MKSLSHSYVWWPGIDSDIVKRVRGCNMCQMNRPSPSKAPLHPWEYPSRPWARIYIDHAGHFMGKMFLVVIDAHSKWINVAIVNSTSAVSTIIKRCSLFATHGIPEQLVSDNESGFWGEEFKQFTTHNGIKHTFTSPYHPSSNGLAERAVQTFKSTVVKMDGPIDVRLSRFLLQYRVTPQTTTGLFPSQLLMRRKIRTCLDEIHPDMSEDVEKKQEKLISGKEPRKFKLDDLLFAKNFHGSMWIPMKVTKITGPLSYEVTTESGVTLRRHVDHLQRRFSEESQTTLSTQEDWSIIDTTPQGRPQPNQVEVSEAQEDRVEPTEPTQSTPENPVLFSKIFIPPMNFNLSSLLT